MRVPFVDHLSRRSQLILLGSGAAIAFASLLLLTGSVLFRDNAPPAGWKARDIPLTDLNPYGAHFFLDREVEEWKRQKTVEMARQAGLAWARQSFLWEEIEPTHGEFDWAKYDSIVNLYRKNGLDIIARLDRPPSWARKNATASGASGPPDNINDYGDFIEAFARHYSGQIYYFQIWNEPNLAREWNDGPIDPSAYVKLLQTAFRRAKAVDPSIRILSAPLAITLGTPYAPGSDKWRDMNDLDFLSAIYEAGAQSYFDVLSANAFGLRSPPEEPADPQKLNFQRVVLQHRIMERNGDSAKPVWINEFGWNAAPDSFPPEKLIWGRVSEEAQANYTVQAIDYARKNWPWAGVFSIWYFRQVGDISPDNSEYYFRMVDDNFATRPLYVRVSEAASAYQTVGPGEYQESAPAASYQGNWRLRVDARASGTTMQVADAPNSKVSLKFWGESLTLIARRGPNAGRLYVSLGGQPVPGLARDNFGSSFVDLFNPTEAWQVQIPIVKNLGRGAHSIELTGDGRGEVNIDGFIVEAGEEPTAPWIPFTIAAIALVGFVTLFVMLWRKK